MSIGWRLGSWGVALLLVLPLLSLLQAALQPDWALFVHLGRTVLADYVVNSLLLVTWVVLLSLLLGLPAGWLMARCELPGRRLLEWLLILPLAMPSYLVAYVYTSLLDYPGPLQAGLRQLFGWQQPQDYWFPAIRSLGGASLMLALVLYPYVYLLSRAAFLEQSDNLRLASRLLGCSAWQSFWRVSLPLARPAIMVAISLVAMETLADFGTVSYFAVHTLTTAINDTWLGYGSLNGAAQLSLCLLMAVLLCLALERLSRRRQHHYQKSMGQDPACRAPLSGLGRALALLYCWVLVAAGFGLPLLSLLEYAWQHGAQSDWQLLLASSLTSLQVALSAAGVTLLVALLLVFVRRLWPAAGQGLPLRLAGFGYAVPGTVLAIGVLGPLTGLDFWLNDLWRWLGLAPPGLLLTGSLLALVFAYVVRFVAVALGAIESSLAKVPPSLDMVTRTLGEGPAGLLRRIHLPLIRKGLVAAGLLIFIEAMKELPAALLLRPFNVETLATQVYQYVKDEQLELGALPAILIVLVGLVPLLCINRYLEHKA